MRDTNGEGSESESNGLIQCCTCEHFGYFHNDKGHNSPHALGECRDQPWDGNRGQWAMFKHPCGKFVKAAQQSQPGES